MNDEQDFKDMLLEGRERVSKQNEKLKDIPTTTTEEQKTHSWSCEECGSIIKTITEEKPNNCACGKPNITYLGYKYREGLVEESLKNFKRKDLFQLIKEESDKKHMGDNNLKMTMFLTMVSGLLKNQKERMSMAVKAGSSEGKDNLIRTNLNNMPTDSFLFLTKATQSTIEDDAKDMRIIAFSEINMNREGGANKDLIEVIKQKTEGGTHSMKKDLRDNNKSVRFEKGEQGTVIFGTTETEMNEEMKTRFICGSIKTDKERIKKVNDNTCDNYADLDKLINNSKEEDNWVRIGLSNFLNKEEQFEIFIPYAKALKKEINGKYLFDFENPRSQRDIKRIFALTCAMTYLHQEQREVIEHKGHKVLVSEPSDFIKVLEVSQEFFNQSYTGIDSRLTNILNVIKELDKGEFNWILRTDIEKIAGVSLNTLKSYLKRLSEVGLIEGCLGLRMNERGIAGSFETSKIYYIRRDVIKNPLIRESELGLLKEHLEKELK